MREEEFQRLILREAKRTGWTVFYVLDSHYVSVRGWPDLTLRRYDEVTDTYETIIWELKTNTGKVDPEQRYWLKALGGEVRRPRHWPEMKERLNRIPGALGT